MLPISEIPFWFSLGENNQGYRLGDWIEEYWKATDTASWLHHSPWVLRDPGELKVLKVLIMALKEANAF